MLGEEDLIDESAHLLLPFAAVSIECGVTIHNVLEDKAGIPAVTARDIVKSGQNARVTFSRKAFDGNDLDEFVINLGNHTGVKLLCANDSIQIHGTIWQINGVIIAGNHLMQVGQESIVNMFLPKFIRIRLTF